MSRDEKLNIIKELSLNASLQQFHRTKDNESLAQLTEIDPPAGDPEVGKAIANILRALPQTNKLHRDRQWNDIDRLYEMLIPQIGKRTRKTDKFENVQDVYNFIANIFFHMDLSDDPDRDAFEGDGDETWHLMSKISN